MRLLFVVAIEASARAVTTTLLPEMLAVIAVSAGAFDTATVIGVFASETVATVATVDVGVPRCTVTQPVMLSTGAVFDEVIVVSAFERSKKTLPTASTRNRPCVVATLPTFGMLTVSEPSFGVLAARTKGNV